MIGKSYLIASNTLSKQKLNSLTYPEDITVVMYETSQDALEYLIENTPAFIVLDNALEPVTGLEIVRKIRKIKRLHKVPVALIDEKGGLELTPPEKKLIDLYIQEKVSEAELVAQIKSYEVSSNAAIRTTHMDLKTTVYLEQAISQLHEAEAPQPSVNMTKAQEMTLSKSQKIEYLQTEVERLTAMLNEYRERYGDMYEEKPEKQAWLNVLLKPVF